MIEKPYSDDDLSTGQGTIRCSMDVPTGSVVKSVDGEFDYEYDFGSMTSLEIRVIDTGGWTVETLTNRRADTPAVEGR